MDRRPLERHGSCPPQGWTASVPRSPAQTLLEGRQASRGLAHRTTAGNVGGLNFRVRDGTGCIPTALAVKPLLEMREDGGYIRISFGRRYLMSWSTPSNTFPTKKARRTPPSN